MSKRTLVEAAADSPRSTGSSVEEEEIPRKNEERIIGTA